MAGGGNQMPHDAKGQALLPGDVVLVPFKVTKVHESDNYSNIDLETLATMPPENKHRSPFHAINSKQMIRANDGDDVSFTHITDGAGTRLLPVAAEETPKENQKAKRKGGST